MGAISETYNRGHKILEIVDILPNVSFTASETDELPNDVRLKKISKLHGVIA